MLCLLAFGDHEALIKSVKKINRSTITIGPLKRLAVQPPSLPPLRGLGKDSFFFIKFVLFSYKQMQNHENLIFFQNFTTL